MLSDQDVEIWGKNIRRLIGAGLAIAAEPEVARAIARAHRALFDALLAEGFAKSDALKIVASSRPPEMKA